MKKRICFLLVALVMMFAFPFQIFGQEIQKNDVVWDLTSAIQPRLSYISIVTPTLTRSGGIRLSVSTYDCDFYAVLDLQQFIDGEWENVDGYEWTLYARGYDSVTDYCTLESGVRYRAFAYVAALDDHGDVIEQVTNNTVPFVAP